MSIEMIQLRIGALLFDDEYIDPQLQHFKQLVDGQLLKRLHFPL
jgi:hypothetical protein